MSFLPASRALEKTGGLHVLRGNLAPDGCVIKTAGVKKLAASRAGTDF